MASPAQAQEVTPTSGTAGLAVQGQRHKSSYQVLPNQPRKNQTNEKEPVRNHYQYWEVSCNLFQALLYSGQPQGEASAGALTFFLMPFLPRCLSHIQAMYPSRGQAQRFLGTKSQLSLPQWFIHPSTALGKEMGHMEHAGAWDGARGQSRTCFVCKLLECCKQKNLQRSPRLQKYQ